MENFILAMLVTMTPGTKAIAVVTPDLQPAHVITTKILKRQKSRAERDAEYFAARQAEWKVVAGARQDRAAVVAANKAERKFQVASN